MAETASTEQTQAASFSGLKPEQLIRMYRLMYLSRRTDDREILLKRQQKMPGRLLVFRLLRAAWMPRRKKPM